MSFRRAPITDSPEFRELEPEPWDGVLIWLLMPWVVLYNLLTQPFATRRNFSPSRTVLLNALTPDQGRTLPAFVVSHLEATEAAVARLGFRDAVRHVSTQRAMKNAPASSTLTNAMTIAPGAMHEDLFVAAASEVVGRFRMTGATFYTRMTDGLLIGTGNEWRLAPPRRAANRDVVVFPDVADIAELYKIHRKRVSLALRAGRTPVAVGWNPPAMHPVEFFQRSADESVAEGIRRGRVEPSSTDEVRLTLEGAIRMTVENTSQLAPFFDARTRRTARCVLREIGM